MPSRRYCFIQNKKMIMLAKLDKIAEFPHNEYLDTIIGSSNLSSINSFIIKENVVRGTIYCIIPKYI